MGIPLSTPATTQDYALQEVGGLTLEEKLGGSRFMKTLRCTTNDAEHAPVVVKVFLKGPHTPNLAAHAAQLREIRARLSAESCPNVLPFELFRETDKAAYLMRQYLHASLRERIGSQPPLEAVEVRWIAFQLLCALEQMHSRGVCHGDIKSENVLLTSWGWLALADLSSAFKPSLLRDDNPADFSFFYDTAGRRCCYVAPERLQPADVCAALNATATSGGCRADGKSAPGAGGDGGGGGAAGTGSAVGVSGCSAGLAKACSAGSLAAGALPTGGAQAAESEEDATEKAEPATARAAGMSVQPAADIFSAGCVIGEAALGGASLLELSDSLAYKNGRFSLAPTLCKVADESLRALISHMCQREPAKRLSAAAYLAGWQLGSRAPHPDALGGCFPLQFRALHAELGARLCALDTDAKGAALLSAQSSLARWLGGAAQHTPTPAPDADGAAVAAGFGEADGVARGTAGAALSLAAEESGPDGWQLEAPDMSAAASRLPPAAWPASGALGSGPSAAVSLWLPEGCADEWGALVEADDRRDALRQQGGGAPGAWPRQPAAAATAADGGGGGSSGSGMWEGGEADGDACRADAREAAEAGAPGQSVLCVLLAPALGTIGLVRSTALKLGLLRLINDLCALPAEPRRNAAPQPSAHAESAWQRPAAEQQREARAQRQRLLWHARERDRVVASRVLPALLRLVTGGGDAAGAPAVPRAPGASGQPSGARASAGGTFAEAGVVRASALCLLSWLAERLNPAWLPAHDVRLMSAFVLPALARLPSDPDPLLRATFADVLTRLAAVSARFVRVPPLAAAAPAQPQPPAQPLAAAGADGRAEAGAHAPAEGAAAMRGGSLHSAADASLEQLRELLTPILIEGLSDPTAAVRRRLLRHAPSLARLLGARRTDDLLLPLLIALLNEHRLPGVRLAFLANVDLVGQLVGPISVEAYVLPCVLDGIADADDLAVAAALACLRRLVRARLCSERARLEVAAKASPLLLHPSGWVRSAALSLLGALLSAMGEAEAVCLLLPLLAPLLRPPAPPAQPRPPPQPAAAGAAGAPPPAAPSPLVLASPRALVRALRAPVSRRTFDAALSVCGSALEERGEAAATAAAPAAGAPWQQPSGRPGAGGADGSLPLPPGVGAEEAETLRAMRGYVLAASLAWMSRVHALEHDSTARLRAAAHGHGHHGLGAEGAEGGCGWSDAYAHLSRTTPVHVLRPKPPPQPRAHWHQQPQPQPAAPPPRHARPAAQQGAAAPLPAACTDEPKSARGEGPPSVGAQAAARAHSASDGAAGAGAGGAGGGPAAGCAGALPAAAGEAAMPPQPAVPSAAASAAASVSRAGGGGAAQPGGAVGGPAPPAGAQSGGVRRRGVLGCAEWSASGALFGSRPSHASGSGGGQQPQPQPQLDAQSNGAPCGSAGSAAPAGGGAAGGGGSGGLLSRGAGPLAAVAGAVASARTAVGALHAHGASVAQRDAALYACARAGGGGSAPQPAEAHSSPRGRHAAAAAAGGGRRAAGAGGGSGGRLGGCTPSPSWSGGGGAGCGSAGGTPLSQPAAMLPGRYSSLGWRPHAPRGSVVTSWRAHAGAVTSLSLSPDHALLASGGADGAVRLWLSASIGVDIAHAASAARSLAGGQPVSALAAWGGGGNGGGGGYRVACGGQRGALDVLEVRGGGVAAHALRREGGRSADGALGAPRVLALGTLSLAGTGAGEPLLLVAESSGAVRAIDLRAPPSEADCWALELPPADGLPCCLASHGAHRPSWLLVGTTRGRCLLWDLRYAARTAAWSASTGGAAACTILPVAAARASGAPTVLVGTGANEVVGFELTASEPSPRLRLRARGASSAASRADTLNGCVSTGGAAEFPSLRTLEGVAAHHRVSALVAPPDGSSVVSASTDGYVRSWELHAAQRSQVLFGPPTEGTVEFRSRAPSSALGGGGAAGLPGSRALLEIDECELGPPARRPPHQRAASERAASASQHHAAVHDILFTSVPHSMLLAATADGTIKVFA